MLVCGYNILIKFYKRLNNPLFFYNLHLTLILPVSNSGKYSNLALLFNKRCNLSFTKLQ